MSRDRSENPVVLSRIYTRTGDDGTTALGDGSRTAKTDSRLAAYADVDEANCAIGVAITFGDLPAGIAKSAVPGAERAVRRGRRPGYPGDALAPVPAAAHRRGLRHPAGGRVRLLQRRPADAAQLPAARREPGVDAAARGADGHTPGGAQRVGRGGRARRRGQPGAGPVPEPAVRPAVHPGPGGQRRARRRAVEAGRRARRRLTGGRRGGNRVARPPARRAGR